MLILITQNYSLETYFKMYLTTSYVLTAPFEHSNAILKIFQTYGLKADIIGEIIEENILRIHNSIDSIDVIKY